MSQLKARDRHLVRKTYKHDRAGQQDRYVPSRLQAYIRPDQAAWLATECAKRSAATVGRYAPASELVREALDLLIEYTQHQEFLRSKLGHGRAAVATAVTTAAKPAAPAAGPDARSPESGAPDPQSSGNSGPA